MNKQHLLNNIIIAYRDTISERYQYKTLKKKYTLPNSVTEDTVNQIRNYFLEYVYPSIEKREELNKAFEALDEFIKNPKKLLNLLKESVKLVFSYGRHLPKILNAGIKALKSYRTASKFENNLVKAAINNNIEAPFNIKKINTLISLLSRKDIEHFIESSQELFEIIHDEKLVKNIKDVLSALISKMKAKDNLFTDQDVKGLQIGLEMIDKGESLFRKFSTEDQILLIDFITQIERDNIDAIFSEKNTLK